MILVLLILVGGGVLTKLARPKEVRRLPGASGLGPERQALLAPLVEQFGYAIESSDGDRCVLVRGDEERCMASFHRRTQERYHILRGEDGDPLREQEEEVVRFDLTLPCSQAWPEALAFALASNGEDAARYLDDVSVTLQEVDRSSCAACRVVLGDDHARGAIWNAQVLLDLFTGEVSLKRFAFYGDLLLLSAVRRGERTLSMRFHLASRVMQTRLSEQILTDLMGACERMRTPLDAMAPGEVMARAYDWLAAPRGECSSVARRLAMMTLQTLGELYPAARAEDHEARILTALNARPREYARAPFIASLSTSQIEQVTLDTLLTLFEVAQTPPLKREVNARMSVMEMVQDERIPDDFLVEALQDRWRDAAPERIVDEAAYTHAHHTTTVLAHLWASRGDELYQPPYQEVVEEMVTRCPPKREEALLALIEARGEQELSARGDLDAHMLQLLEQGKWQHGRLIQHVLLANDQLPPAQIEAWHRSVPHLDLDVIRDKLLELETFDEESLSLWTEIGEHAPHYEALERDGACRARLVERLLEVYELETPEDEEEERARAIAVARYASVWLRHEEEVFGDAEGFNFLMNGLSATLSYLEEAPYDAHVVEPLTTLSARLLPSMSSVVTKAIKRWQERRAAWSQGALTFVESTTQGALTLDEGPEEPGE